MKKVHYIIVLILIATALMVVSSRGAVAEEFKISPQVEQEQLAILRSDSPKADKAIACKKLAIDGSAASVPDLAKLLSDPELASWTRIALEAIPGTEADEALRKATESLDGVLLVGVINSIGVRRDAAAAELLTGRLKDQDAEVASAAAVALGKIGTAEAAEALQEALAGSPKEVRSAVAEGIVLCAERQLADGKAAEAVALYDAVRKAEVPPQRVAEATRGAILARGADGISLLVEQLRSPDDSMFQLGLTVAREFPGEYIDKALAAELESAPPQRAALIVTAMADRPLTVDVPSIAEAATATRGGKPVQLAAIRALGRIGNSSATPALLAAAIGDDLELSEAAKQALADLPGDDVNKQIVAMLPQVQGKAYPVLIELVGRRRIQANDTLLKAVEHRDAAVRKAALLALGETADLKGLPALIAQVTTPKNADDVQVAQQALRAASIRQADREAAATQLAAAYERTSSAETKSTLLEILGAMGGAKALATVHAAAKSRDPQLQDVSTRLLGEWMTADAAPVLLDLARRGPGDKYQIRAVRAYIRIARQFALPDDQRTQMIRDAFVIARQPAEQKLVMEVLRRYPSEETLQMAISAMSNSAVKDDASATTLAIAQQLGQRGIDVSQHLANAGFEKVKVEIIKAEYGSGSTQKDVTAVLRKQVGDLPIIALPGDTYNKSFGGDPAPGMPKQLKVQYRIDGKSAEATFAEGALIVLPMPK